MRLPKMLLASIVAVALAAPAAGADTFTIDPVHSEIGFAVKHMVISTVRGHFNDFSGTITYDPQDLARSGVGVTIKAASIDTGNAGRDKDLKSEGFLAADTFPDITFKSTRIERQGDGYLAHGQLTLRGVTHEVALPFTIGGPIQDPWGNTRIGVTIAPVVIDRQDYGVSWSKRLDSGGLVVADEVTLELSVEAVKKVQASAG